MRWNLVRQLQDFKSGVRGSNPKDTYGAQMKSMAAMLANDQAINNVVAYIRTLKQPSSRRALRHALFRRLTALASDPRWRQRLLSR